MRKVLFLFGALILAMNSNCTDRIIYSDKHFTLSDTIQLDLIRKSQTAVELAISKKRNNSGDLYQLIRTDLSRTQVIGTHKLGTDTFKVLDANFGLNLTPSTLYRYQVVRMSSDLFRLDSSQVLDVKTLDIAGSNIEWQVIETGIDGYYYDVWAENETNIYILGSKSSYWNYPFLLHYDGNNWQEIPEIGGHAIWGFSGDDIWIVGYFRIFHFNGTDWQVINESDKILHENRPYYGIWGVNSNHLFLTSTKGKIIFWNGQSASVMQTPITETLGDIFGLASNFILATTWIYGDGDLLIYNGSDWSSIKEDNYFGTKSVYPFSNNEFFVCGWDYIKRVRNGFLESILEKNRVSFYRIRGDVRTGELFSVNHLGDLYHYNGVDWSNISEKVLSGITKAPMHGLFVHKKFVLAVGDNKRVIIGNRE